MAKEKEEYVVGVLFAYEDRTEIKYVTGIEHKPKNVYWKDGEEAKVFPKDYAVDLALGLCLNGNAAIPMLKANYLTLRNPNKESEK